LKRIKGKIVNTNKQMDWQKILNAQMRGARWGDLEVFDDDELEAILVRGIKKEKASLVGLNFTVRTKCKCCTFKKHSNPPADFTEEQKEYCCAFCAQTGGKRHGERCEKRR